MVLCRGTEWRMQMKVVVLAGGLSTERDVSITSGMQVCKALRERGHKAVLLDVFLGYGSEGEDISNIFEGDVNLSGLTDRIQSVDPDVEKIKNMRGGDPRCFFGANVIRICQMADIVYMGLHGAEGENGKVQAAFDMFGIRYTGSGYLGSALAMDKGMAKKVFQATGIPTPKGFTVTPDTICPVPEEIGYPCVVKPCCGGSSVGVSIPQNEQEYQKALETAFRYESEVLVEEFICGREFSVGVIAGRALPVIEIIPKTGFYDYETKYQAGMAEDVCPAQLDETMTTLMQEWAVRVYRELKLEIYARIDFLLDAGQNMYCLEANTLPGMTPTSLLPQEAKAEGIEYGALCEMIIKEALKRYKESPDKKKQYMTGMTLEAVARAVHGVYSGPPLEDKTLSSITIDSRKVEKDSLFVAIRGQRADGNDFIENAYEQGALCCMSTLPPQNNSRPYIQVESCEQALKDMAEYYRSISKVTVVGITGSVGKTTTKEMVASVLSQKYDVLKTPGNFNNEIGLPLTVFQIRPHHQAAVLEMGISDFGEMSRLARVARPDMAVITNIGQCHLENLGSRDGVLRAKTEILDYLAPEGKVCLNGDDDKLLTLRSDSRLSEPVYFSRRKPSGDFTPDIYIVQEQSLGLAGTEVTMATPAGEMRVTVPAPGHHMVSNAMAATAVGLGMQLSLEQIKAGIESYRSLGGHGHIIRTEAMTILDDCYNANPASMKAGIDVLADAGGRTVAILGDMFELGANERRLHFEIGEYIAGKGITVLVAVGTLAREYAEGALAAEKENGVCRIFRYENTEEALAHVGEWLEKNDSVLVKASHAMKFEKIVAQLKSI